MAYFSQRGCPPVILQSKAGSRKSRMVIGIPIFIILSGMIKIPTRLSIHAIAPTPPHTARHLAAYLLASVSFLTSASHCSSVLILSVLLLVIFFTAPPSLGVNRYFIILYLLYTVFWCCLLYYPYHTKYCRFLSILSYNGTFCIADK